MAIRELAIILSITGVTSANAQTSQDYAVMGKRAWSAFECASLASTAGLSSEHERHFRNGYDFGKAFLDAVQAGNVEGPDIASIVPMGFTMAMRGPSADFMLGVIWSAAIENSHRGIYEEEWTEKPIDPSLWKTLAETKYRKTNCELL